MAFVVFAAAAVAWSLFVIRWSFSIRRAAAAVVVASVAVVTVGMVSLILDLRSIHLARSALRSTLVIHVVRHDDWWQLDYQRDDVSFTTANELHVPAGTAVTLTYAALPAPAVDSGVCLPLTAGRYAMIVRGPTTCRLGWRTIRVMAERPAQFEAWLRNEARPARASCALFADAGCAYCHVIRGVAASPSTIAPDLTHFAARATIAAIDLPNRQGNLAGWIVNSRALKHGSGMPQNRLHPAALHALVAYLESLR